MTPLRFSSLHLHQVGRGICTLLGHEHARHTSGRSRRAGGLTVVSSPKGCQVNLRCHILNQDLAPLP